MADKLFAGVTVVAGPAGSGKTERLLGAYRRLLAAGPPGVGLWISPTVRGANELRGRLLGPGLAGCFSPNCLTFARFAEQILAASSLPRGRLTPLLKRRLLARLIDQHRTAGRLHYFSPIAEMPGLVDLVDQFVTELKRLEIWPEEFARACQARGKSAKDRELVALYEAYQKLLVDHRLYDAEGIHWAARTLLQAGRRRPFENVRFVVVDGFTDFTRTQHEMLQALAEQGSAIAISLPLEAAEAGQPPRSDLFAKTNRTLQELRERHTQLQVESLPRRGQVAWPLGAQLEAQLFHGPRQLLPASDTVGLEIVGAAGQVAEIEMVGARIKRLLVAGDDLEANGKPIPASEILVVFRSLAELGPLVREVFAEMGIPVSLELRPPLSTVSPLAALLKVLELDLADWPFRDLLAVLGHNCLQPACYEDVDQTRAHVAAVAAAEHLVRMLQMPAGRDQLIVQIERFAQQPPRIDDAGQVVMDNAAVRRQRASLALPLLHYLAAAIDKLPKQATGRQWAGKLQTLVDALGLMRGSAATTEQAEVERAAFVQLLSELESLENLAETMGESSPLLTRQELVDQIADILRREELPPRHDDVGRVRVLSAASARNLSAKYVFLCSLVEKSFPAALGDANVYSEAEILRLIGEGLPLSSRLERSQDEMLLFYEVVTRATRHLWLSYPALDDKAQPLSPSPYLDEVERACGRTSIERRVVPHLSPVPERASVCSQRDLRVAAVHEALGGRAGLLAGLKAKSRAAADGVMWGIRAVEARAHREGFGQFEGVLGDPAILAELAKQFGPERCWSTSQLEQYAKCPFQFFAQRVLHLQPLEELSLETDYSARGRMLHGALASLHRRINARYAGPTSAHLDDEAELLADIATILDSIATTSGKLPALDAALREIDRQLVRQWLASYHKQHGEYDSDSGCDKPPRPAYFEAAFGPQHVAADDPEAADPDAVESDSLSCREPYVIERAGESIKLGGRIDRIDVGRAGGKLVFNVMDYKSGSARSYNKQAVDDGLALQLPLYAIVVQELLLEADGAVPWHAGYWFVKEKGFHKHLECYESGAKGVTPTAAWLAQREKLLDRVVSLVRAMRAGAFAVFSADDECTGRCDFAKICRIGQVRSLDKVWKVPEVEAP